jgi:hypothetical protein
MGIRQEAEFELIADRVELSSTVLNKGVLLNFPKISTTMTLYFP